MNPKKKSPQDIQDEIFSKMSSDQKVEIGSKLWRLAKELNSDKINYGRHKRPTSSSS